MPYYLCPKRTANMVWGFTLRISLTRAPLPWYFQNMKEPPEKRAWYNMLARCYNPTDVRFARYGGRGVTVCDRWRGPLGFQHFFEDMGPRPIGQYSNGQALYSLDRIQNVTIYSKETCRWTTRDIQSATGMGQRRRRALDARSTTKVKGVTYNKRDRRYVAQGGHLKKHYYFGSFLTLQAASDAYTQGMKTILGL